MNSPGHGRCKGHPDPNAFPRKSWGRAPKVPFLSLGIWGPNGLEPHRRGPERQPVQGCSAAVEPKSLPGRSRSSAAQWHMLWTSFGLQHWAGLRGSRSLLPPALQGPQHKHWPWLWGETDTVYRTLVLVNTDQLIRKARDLAGREENSCNENWFFFFFLLSYLFLVFPPVSFSCAQCLT